MTRGNIEFLIYYLSSPYFHHLFLVSWMDFYGKSNDLSCQEDCSKTSWWLVWDCTQKSDPEVTDRCSFDLATQLLILPFLRSISFPVSYSGRCLKLKKVLKPMIWRVYFKLVHPFNIYKTTQRCSISRSYGERGWYFGVIKGPFHCLSTKRALRAHIHAGPPSRTWEKLTGIFEWSVWKQNLKIQKKIRYRGQRYKLRQ